MHFKVEKRFFIVQFIITHENAGCQYLNFDIFDKKFSANLVAFPFCLCRFTFFGISVSGAPT